MCPPVQLCVCVYALRQAAGCVKAGPGPAASQEDRRGSRWICLDLTLPTPLHPPGPPLPTCTSLCSVEGRERSRSVCFGGMGGTCYATSTKQREQEDGEKPERAERDFAFADFSLTDPLCVELCWHMAPVSMLELLVCSAVSLQLFSLSAVCSLRPNWHFACLSRECLAFSGILSHHTLWDSLAVCRLLRPLILLFSCSGYLLVVEVSPASI